MKNLVAAFITALLVFILATGWMEVVQPRLELAGLTKSAKGRESSMGIGSARTETAAEDDDESDEVTSGPVARKSTKSSRAARQIRDEAEKTKAQVALQLEEVRKQEAKLVAREENLRMLYDDIRSELASIEDLRRRSAVELAMAEQKVLDAARNNPNVAATSNDGSRTAAVAKSDKSAQASIAGLVQDLASRGSIETAAGLLRGMKDREIAKVLTSLSTRDPRLANQLFEQVRTARQETTIRR